MDRQVIKYLSIALFVGLLLWGVYTLLYYLGVPVHDSVLLTGEARGRLDSFCDGSAFACRGLFALFPMISHTFSRMSPLFSYAIFSAVLYGGFLFVQGVRTGYFALRFRMKPWHVLGFFLLSLTLIFQSISFGKVDIPTSNGVRQMPLRMLVEPTTSVYRNAGTESLSLLQANFQRLMDKGCLKQHGTFSEGASTFLISARCIYVSYAKLVLSQVLFILGILFELLIAGSIILRLAKIRPRSHLVEFMFNIATGAAFWVVLLWSYAVFGILTKTLGWASMMIIPLIGYKHVVHWARMFVRSSVSVDKSWYSPSILVMWLLISYLALNFYNVVRPFPIGWDDLGSYLNRPRLMVSYGSFIFSMAPFMWEYMTSLGFLLFGYNSIFGATASMMINWMAGALAVLAIYTFGVTYLGKGRGVLSALLYYSLPLVGHFSFADMKIDNSIFMWSVMGLLAMFYFLFPPQEESEEGTTNPLRYVLLAGLLLGFAFSTKATTIMVIMAAGAILLGAQTYWTAFAGSVLFALAIYAKKGILGIPKIMDRVLGNAEALSPMAFVIGCIVVGLLCFAVAIHRSNTPIKRVVQSIGMFGLGLFIAIFPWIMHNNLLIGNIIPKFQMGAPNNISTTFDLSGENAGKPMVRSLPPELAVDNTSSFCSATGHLEELDRYWGFRKGWKHYLTLPWRSVMNLDSGGYYVTTMPGLLLFPLLLLVPFFWLPAARWMRWIFAGTLFMVVEWIFLANGIPWYGLGMFFGLCIGLEFLLIRAPDVPSRSIISVLITLCLLIVFNNRFWQYEMQRNLFEYPMGKVSYETLRERTIPYYDDISDMVLARTDAMPDRPFLYRMGTFIPYFLPRNLEIIGMGDHQLDTFNCLYQERDPKLTTQRLKALGFHSIIFDTNTHTIERNPNGSLHKKVSAFLDYVNNPDSGLEGIISDTGAGVAYILIP